MFYGGIVQAKNYLSTVMQVFTITCLVACEWMIFGACRAGSRASSYVRRPYCRTTGYSLSFRPGIAVIGGASRFWLLGMNTWSIHPLAPTIPESVYMVRARWELLHLH